MCNHWRMSLLAMACLYLLSGVANGSNDTSIEYREMVELMEVTDPMIETEDSNTYVSMQNVQLVMSKIDELKIHIDKRLTNIAGDSGCEQYCSRATVSGVYTISIDGTGQDVYCEVDQDGHKWVVIQRRQDGSVSFTRNWADYSQGFGNLAGEFWLGNEKIHALTVAGLTRLRIDLVDWQNKKHTVFYNMFLVKGSQDNYKMTVSCFVGSTPPGAAGTVSGPVRLCMSGFKSWWFDNCYGANLNGEYNNTTPFEGINWHTWHGLNYPLKQSTVMIAKPTV